MTRMTAQLPLFDHQAFEFLADVEALPEESSSARPTQTGLVGFEQPALDRLLPARYLQGLNVCERQNQPFDKVTVLWGTGSDVQCNEMLWGLDIQGAALPPTLPSPRLWRRLFSRTEALRCVVIASLFELRSVTAGRQLTATVRPANDAPFFLAGEWRLTPKGGVCSLFERPSKGLLRRAGPSAPLILGELDVWRWLNGNPWILFSELDLPRPRHVISLTACNSR